jgi:hypothetical protein
MLQQLQLARRMYAWLVFGYLAMPHELSSEAALDAFRTALQDGFVATVFRNEARHPSHRPRQAVC